MKIQACLALALALIVAACGTDTVATTARADTDPSTTTPSTTTPLPAPPAAIVEPSASSTTEAPQPELSIILAGDSIMADTAPAALAAFREASRPIRARFELAPSVPRSFSDLMLWTGILEHDRPDVVVVLIGIWEAGSVNKVTPLAGENWQDPYRRMVLLPWLDWLESNDITTIWVGMPQIDEPLVNGRVQSVMRTIAEVAGQREHVRFVHGDHALAPLGAYVDSLTGEFGLERVRRIDGLHLCPAGAARVASLIVDVLGETEGVTVSDGWQDGGWRSAVAYDADLECPAP